MYLIIFYSLKQKKKSRRKIIKFVKDRRFLNIKDSHRNERSTSSKESKVDADKEVNSQPTSLKVIPRLKGADSATKSELK